MAGIVAVGIGCGGSGSNGGGDTTAPPPPSNLSGTSGDGEITLTWDGSGANDLQKYNIYRSTSSPVDISGTAPLQTTRPGETSETSVTDGELTKFTTYYYVVTAVDDSGNESSPSGVFEQTFPSPPEDRP
jgi:fibronectin type 3 domain-containing protein